MAAEPNAVEQAVSRTLRDNLEKVQRTADEVHQAVNDMVAACASSRPSNALPSMLRAQTSAAALSATLDVLARFVTASLQPPMRMAFETDILRVPSMGVAPAAAFEQPPPPPTHPMQEISLAAPVPSPAPVVAVPAEPEAHPLAEQMPAVPEIQSPVEAHVFSETPPVVEMSAPVETPVDAPVEAVPMQVASADPVSFEPAPVDVVPAWEPPNWNQPLPGSLHEPVESFEAGLPVEDRHAAELHGETEAHAAVEPQREAVEEHSEFEFFSDIETQTEIEVETGVEPMEAEPIFNLDSLPPEEQELHRRAFRVAKVSMQDIRMLRPEDVRIGRENKDLCFRLRDDIEKAHKEYDRRFQSIQSHPVDYFYNWMVEILAGGDPQALGEYPYPSPVLRR